MAAYLKDLLGNPPDLPAAIGRDLRRVQRAMRNLKVRTSILIYSASILLYSANLSAMRKVRLPAGIPVYLCQLIPLRRVQRAMRNLKVRTRRLYSGAIYSGACYSGACALACAWSCTLTPPLHPAARAGPHQGPQRRGPDAHGLLRHRPRRRQADLPQQVGDQALTLNQAMPSPTLWIRFCKLNTQG